MVRVDWQAGTQYRIQNEHGYTVQGTSAAGEEGMTPMELLSSSLAMCVAISLVKLMERDGIDPELVSVSAKAEKAPDSPSRVARFVIDIQLAETIEPAYRSKLIRMAERACTIGNTLKLGADIAIVSNDS